MSLSGFTKALVVAGFSAFSSMASAGFIPDILSVGGPTIAQACSASGFADCKIRESDSIESIADHHQVRLQPDHGRVHDGDLRPVPDDRRQRVQFRLHRRGRDRDLDIHPGAGDPAINFFVAKGGPGFNLFNTLGTYRRLVHTG